MESQADGMVDTNEKTRLPLLPDEVWTNILAFFLPLHHVAQVATRFDAAPARRDIPRTRVHYIAGVASSESIPRSTSLIAARELLSFSLVSRWARALVLSGSIPLWKPLYFRLWTRAAAVNEHERVRTNISESRPESTEPDYYELILARNRTDVEVSRTLSTIVQMDHGGAAAALTMLARLGNDAFDRLTDLSRSVADFPRLLRSLHLELCAPSMPSLISRASNMAPDVSMAFVAGRSGLGLLPMEQAKLALDPAMEQRWKRLAGAGELMPGTFPTRSAVELEQEAATGPYLAIRSWADEMRSHLLKLHALRLWKSMMQGEEISFEDGLLAFSAFRGGDPIEAKAAFDRWTRYISDQWSIFQSQTGEWGGVRFDKMRTLRGDLERLYELLGGTLRDNGIRPAMGADFHELNGGFIHIVLGNRRQTLPMTLAVLWVAILRRLGLDAAPINFPGQIMLIVSGVLPDSWALANLDTSRYTFPHWLRFYTSHDIVYEAEMVELLRLTTGGRGTFDMLQPARTLNMVDRTSRNIVVSLRNGESQLPEHEAGDSAQAAAFAWLCVYLAPGEPTVNENVTLVLNGLNWLQGLLHSTKPAWLDGPLVETALELTESIGIEAVRSSRIDLLSTLDWKMERERERPSAKIECVQAMSEGRMHTPGTFMKHAKYHYVGIIVGGDTTCTQSEAWISAMSVDSLSRGRHQPFYHVQNSTGGSTFVAHENVHPFDEASPIPDVKIYQLLQLHPSLGLLFDSIDLVRSRMVPSRSLLAMYPAMS